MNLPSALSSGHVLLVIACAPVDMQLLTQLLDRRGNWHLLTASSGTAGIKLAETSQPQVVILDWGPSASTAMGILNGLRGNSLTSHIPVIALSSDAMPAQIAVGLKAGCYRYLTKPYKLTALLDAIESSLAYLEGESERFQLSVNT